MSYDCPDFYDDVCRAAGEHLGVQFTEHEGTEIDCDAESVVLAIKRAARERRELLEACEQAEYWLTEHFDVSVDDAVKPEEMLRVMRAAIAKVQS